jgi:DNA repair exonuclease SbcCD ATPase subunit
LSRDDFYMPTDMDALRMENELLTFEVRFLKAQLSAREAEHERSATQLQSRLEESERRLEESERRLEESERRLEESERRLEESEHSTAQLRTRLAEAERAEQDLVLLLRRLANSPLGWFLGLKQNFRILERRYLDTDA